MRNELSSISGFSARGVVLKQKLSLRLPPYHDFFMLGMVTHLTRIAPILNQVFVYWYHLWHRRRGVYNGM